MPELKVDQQADVKWLKTSTVFEVKWLRENCEFSTCYMAYKQDLMHPIPTWQISTHDSYLSLYVTPNEIRVVLSDGVVTDHEMKFPRRKVPYIHAQLAISYLRGFWAGLENLFP